jgi:hypothetical protein
MLVITASDWPLLKCGRSKEVVVRTGLTVCQKFYDKYFERYCDGNTYYCRLGKLRLG